MLRLEEGQGLRVEKGLGLLCYNAYGENTGNLDY